MINKKWLIQAALIGLTMGVVYMGWGVIKRTHRKVEFTKHVLSEDFIHLFSIGDSALFHFPEANSTLLVYFNSGCEHCRKEFKEIARSKDRFAGIEIVFFSMENIRQIAAFAEQNKVHAQSNFHFTKINLEHQGEVFGSLMTPSFFAYKNGKLVMELKGEQTFEEILKSFL